MSHEHDITDLPLEKSVVPSGNFVTSLPLEWWILNYGINVKQLIHAYDFVYHNGISGVGFVCSKISMTHPFLYLNDTYTNSYTRVGVFSSHFAMNNQIIWYLKLIVTSHL